MKILYITTIGSTMNFFNSFIKQLLDEGHSVDIATNETARAVPDCYREWNCAVHQIDTSRSPFDKGNIKAVRQIRQLVEKEKYDIVHCHTPVAAMCTRLACKDLRKQGTKVIYTAHGFHFFKGAPLVNWLVYFPVEWFLARYTDVLITINKEDYARAQKFAAKKVYYVPGVGVDTKKFSTFDKTRSDMRAELGLKNDHFVLLSVGELINRKNHAIVLQAMAKLRNEQIYQKLQYLICGRGTLEAELKELTIKLGISDHVHFLGYRSDISEICNASDLFVFMSLQEGLPVALMEAMACGLPVVCSDIRGNTDLITDSVSGNVIENTPEAVSDAIKRLCYDSEKRISYAMVAKRTIQQFDLNNIAEKMHHIYLNDNYEGVNIGGGNS